MVIVKYFISLGSFFVSKVVLSGILISILFGSVKADANVGISAPLFGCRFTEGAKYQVDCPTPPAGTISRSKLHKHIFAVVTILGSEPALTYLEKNGNLPLRVTFIHDGVRQDTVDYGINPKDWFKNREALRFEFERDGYFAWRTSIISQKIWGGKLELIFEDYRGGRVAPVGDPESYSATIHFSD
ncbi:hypothetical protein [Labrenzia sp. OB1]|uniref:hypothetical protein n=1 Tax=Labrenzia sp. OB1 TaxID=1561204 RepID=UPI000AFA3DB4|nr:hypothetical protein [Labrenzia sp. OB1]